MKKNNKGGNGATAGFTKKVAEQIGKFLIETYLDKRLNEFEKVINYKIDGVKSEIAGLRDKFDGLSHKVDGLNAKDEAIKYLLDELKKNGAK